MTTALALLLERREGSSRLSSAYSFSIALCRVACPLSLLSSPRVNSGPISFRAALLSRLTPFGRLRPGVISPRLILSSFYGRLMSQLQSWRVLVTACFMTCGSCFLLNVKSSGRQMIFILVVDSPSPLPLSPLPSASSSPSLSSLLTLFRPPVCAIIV